MPFPFRNPVNPSYDNSDDNDGQQTDPKLEGIVQKMIDAGEPEENIASVIKSYKPAPAGGGNAQQPIVKPTAGTGKGSGTTPNPDSEWWKGFGDSLFGGEAAKTGMEGALGWGKGAIADIPSTVMGGLKTVGGMVTNPSQTMSNIGQSLKALPGQIADTTAKAGSDPYAFGEMAGQMGGQPLMMDIAPGMMKAAAPTIGRGMQSVGDFVAKNQPVTGMAPPVMMPRTLRLIEKGVGKGVGYAGKLLGDDAPAATDTADTINNVKPKAPASLKKQNLNISGAGPNIPLSSRAQPAGYGFGMKSDIADTIKNLMTQDTDEPSRLDISSIKHDTAGTPIFDAGPLSNVKPGTLDLSGSNRQLNMDELLNTPITNNASGESSASVEALNRQQSMKTKGQQFYVYDKTGQGRPLIGPDAVDYTAQKGETYGILNKDGSFQKLDDNGGRPPTSISQNQGKATAIQDNIDKKYGPGNTSKASPSTQKTLSDTKQQIPVINRPGTYITLKSPTPDMIQQAQKLGFQFDSKTSEGNWRMKQTGKPMTVNSTSTNTSLSNIDLNAPINIGGSE